MTAKTNGQGGNSSQKKPAECSAPASFKCMTESDIDLDGKNGLTQLPCLGKGSFGNVHDATVEGLRCAAKVIHAPVDLSDDRRNGQLATSHARELEALGHAVHPNVVKLLFVITPDAAKHKPGVLFCECVDGDTVRRLILNSMPANVAKQQQAEHVPPDAPMPCPTAVKMKRLIIHRDLKPANSLLHGNDQDLKIADFGASAMIENTGMFSSRTRKGGSRSMHSSCGKTMGTLGCFGDETTKGAPTDMFAVGVILAQSFTHLDVELGCLRQWEDDADSAPLLPRWQGLPELAAEDEDEAETLSKFLSVLHNRRWFLHHPALLTDLPKETTCAAIGISAACCGPHRKRPTASQVLGLTGSLGHEPACVRA